MTTDKPKDDAGAPVCSKALLADRITSGLLINRNALPWNVTPETEADLEWIAKRYEELRITHPQGFSGAYFQSRREFVEMVLSANASLERQEPRQ